MKIKTLLVLTFGCFGLFGANAQGGISPEMLQTLRQSYQNTSSDKALRNAMGSTNIQTLAINQENQNPFDTHFTYEVKSKGITDQKSSGRCWLFSGLNVLRAQAMREHHLGKLEFSQVYNFFYDQLEKANLFLQGVIDTRHLPMDNQMVEWLFKHPLSDGGQFTGVSDLIEKYGLVPKEVMNETYSSDNTARIANLITLKLREQGLALRELPKKVKSQEIETMKTDMLKTIYRMLVLAYGEPVQKFKWTRTDSEGKVIDCREYTPQSFYKEYLGNDLTGNYVMLMNDPTREYYKVYSIDYDRHVYDGRDWTYINLPINEIKKAGIEALKNNVMMYFSCDVGKFLDRKRGLLDIKNFDYESLMGTKFKMDKKQRVMTFASGSSHAMTLMAVDLDKDGKPTKWMVENSWGDTGYKGHLVMTDEWFNEYMFRLVVEKRFLGEDILQLLNQKPIRLPAWDPMFAEEE